MGETAQKVIYWTFSDSPVRMSVNLMWPLRQGSNILNIFSITMSAWHLNICKNYHENVLASLKFKDYFPLQISLYFVSVKWKFSCCNPFVSKKRTAELLQLTDCYNKLWDYLFLPHELFGEYFSKNSLCSKFSYCPMYDWVA